MRPLSEPRTVLILGGARSGKSAFAERLARTLGEPVLFVATAQPLDRDMEQRIAAHRASRPPAWDTLEAFTEVGRAIRDWPSRPAAILLDCVTLLVSNLLLRKVDHDGGRELQEEADAEIDSLLGAANGHGAVLVVVSNEVGLGIVPEDPHTRLYRDVLGRANQRLAAAATDVYFMVAGIPVVVKGSQA